MNATRRSFLGAAIGTGLAASAPRARAAGEDPRELSRRLDEVAEAPVLRLSRWRSRSRSPRWSCSRHRRNFLVRVRTTDGAEGIGVPNAMHLVHTYPIFLNRVAPFFVGKDARQLEPMLWELYRHDDNYKYQGLALWVCVAAAEFAVLDLLGKLTGKSIGDLLGGVRRREIAVYRASGVRGNTPEQEVAYLKELVAETGARALKFRLGGRMSKNADSLPGRTERLIPMVREAFGKEMTLYADSNSSYDAAKAIEIGRLMEEYDYAFYEEPCRFDHLEETKAVADALRIPVAGGEQESSEDRLPLGHRQPGPGHHPARPALLRRVHPLDAGRPDGGRRRPALHAAHVGLGAGLPRRGDLRLVHPQPRTFHRVQGGFRHPGHQRDLVAEGRERHGPRAIRARLRDHHRPGLRPRIGPGDDLLSGLRGPSSTIGRRRSVDQIQRLLDQDLARHLAERSA